MQLFYLHCFMPPQLGAVQFVSWHAFGLWIECCVYVAFAHWASCGQCQEMQPGPSQDFFQRTTSYGAGSWSSTFATCSTIETYVQQSPPPCQ